MRQQSQKIVDLPEKWKTLDTDKKNTDKSNAICVSPIRVYKFSKAFHFQEDQQFFVDVGA